MGILWAVGYRCIVSFVVILFASMSARQLLAVERVFKCRGSQKSLRVAICMTRGADSGEQIGRRLLLTSAGFGYRPFCATM